MCPENRDITRMRSSEIRTVRCSGHLGRGCLPRGVSAWGDVCPRGCLPGGVCLRGFWVYLPGGGCGQTDTCKKNMTFPQLLLRRVTMFLFVLTLWICVSAWGAGLSRKYGLLKHCTNETWRWRCPRPGIAYKEGGL